jgi:hypothetical protein
VVSFSQTAGSTARSRLSPDHMCWVKTQTPAPSRLGRNHHDAVQDQPRCHIDLAAHPTLHLLWDEGLSALGVDVPDEIRPPQSLSVHSRTFEPSSISMVNAILFMPHTVRTTCDRFSIVGCQHLQQSSTSVPCAQARRDSEAALQPLRSHCFREVSKRSAQRRGRIELGDQ